METAPPLVTVLLPTCNRRDFLAAAIGSIRDQTFRDWKLLVLNDGGEDVSDVVAGFGDPRIEYHALPHRGKAAALNAGLALVRSKYVSYMDDDDLVYPDHLTELVALAERRRRIENDADVRFDDIRLFNRINHKQILHTKRLADEAGPYDERLRILIDYDYIRRLAHLATPVHLRKTTGEHFLRQTSEDENGIASITGLWVSDPAAAGRSIAAVFEKDPAALTEIYLRANRYAPTCEALAQARDSLRNAGKRIETIERSLSYRLGMALTAPLRWIAELLRRPRKN